MSASPDAIADAQRWMRYAEEDLALAGGLASGPETSARMACWHAQQGAEKALKAALIALGTAFPRTHNLLSLRALLPHELAVRMAVPALAELTQWAAESRYPGDWDEPTAEDARAAYLTATSVFAAVLRLEWFGG